MYPYFSKQLLYKQNAPAALSWPSQVKSDLEESYYENVGKTSPDADPFGSSPKAIFHH